MDYYYICNSGNCAIYRRLTSRKHAHETTDWFDIVKKLYCAQYRALSWVSSEQTEKQVILKFFQNYPHFDYQPGIQPSLLLPSGKRPSKIQQKSPYNMEESTEWDS